MDAKMYPVKLPVLVVVHGGAGSAEPGPGKAYILQTVANIAALQIGKKKQALDIVDFAVSQLEDAGLFNAGCGAVSQSDGKRWLDASLMDGKTGRFGAVAGLSCTTNAAGVARKVMEETAHLMLAGEGADRFAKKWKFPKAKWKRKKAAIKKHKSKHGTVGAVALDRFGNLAAATSTGGISGAMAGRVGDSPILGAGTYADKSCAVSCTGRGEGIIKTLLAYQAALCVRRGKSAQKAADLAIRMLTKIRGSGGLIVIDKHGNTGIAFNTLQMLWAASQL